MFHLKIYIAAVVLVISAAIAAEGASDRPPADLSVELSAARKAWQDGDALAAKARSDFSVLEKQEQAYEKAVALFKKALEKDRHSPQANAEFGRFWLSRREFVQARAHLELALRTLDEERKRRQAKPDAPPLYVFEASAEADVCRTLGGLLERAAEYPQAMEVYRQAVKLDPANARNVVSLSIALCAGGRPGEALALLEPLAEQAKATEEAKAPPLSKAASDSLIVYTLAVCLEETGRLEEALGLYQRALKLAVKAGAAETSSVGDHALMATARIEDLLDAMTARGKAREAENAERKKNNKEPLPELNERADYASAAYRCAEGIKLKNIALSEEDFVLALARLRAGIHEPGDDGIEKHPMFESFIGAMQAFQEATQKHPRFARAHYELALCQLLQGRYGSARALIDAAALYSPNDIATLNVQGEVLLELGQWDEAANVYRRMLMLEHESGAANFGLARALAGTHPDPKSVQTALDALDRAAHLGVRDRRMSKSDRVTLTDGREFEGKLQFEEKENLYLLHTDAKTYSIKKEKVKEIREQPGLREQLVAMKERLDRGESIEKGPVLKGSKTREPREQDAFFNAGSIFQP
ncbi:MAG TPA: tetratricopeptide repeat protein [Planctomycetota bacterium]|nr:tetratricopeptide repeat protein [Planctomycetota bacterium]